MRTLSVLANGQQLGILLFSTSVLRILMDRNNLGVADLHEVGSKLLVSKILNAGDPQLTREHIDASSKRFNISPALFF